MTRKAWSYQTVPLKSLSQVLKIVSSTKKAISNVISPLLVMQVEEDHIVSPESADYIISKSKSREKKIITIPKSYHMFLIDKYASRVHEEILNFVSGK